MKLAVIYNVWDGTELLKYSMDSMKSRAEVFIIVFQNVSNFGEHYAPLSDMELKGYNVVLKLFTPQIGVGAQNETAKRNIGIEVAKNYGCTHFLLADCDELYAHFPRAVDQYLSSGAAGSACKMYTYFKHPTWRFENFDNYYVPFIHKLRPDSKTGAGGYPFYVDPTRRINCGDVALIDEPMHHFSYVRKDIRRKARNSSARVNIEKSQLLQDYFNPACGPGFFVKDFNQKLIEVDNIFEITPWQTESE